MKGDIVLMVTFALIIAGISSLVFLGFFFYSHEEGHRTACLELGGTPSVVYTDFFGKLGGLGTLGTSCEGLDNVSRQLFLNNSAIYEMRDYMRYANLPLVFIFVGLLSFIAILAYYRLK